jgi:hypothetical protein
MSETLYSLDVVARNGVRFTVVLDLDGYWYQKKHLVISPIVEFYDARYKDNGDRCHLPGNRRHDWSMFGQFTGASYNLGTLLERNRNFGLDLAGDVDAWTIDAHTMLIVYAWVEHLTARLPEIDGAEVFANV